MSTTSSHIHHAAQGAPPQPACTLALAGNSRSRRSVRMETSRDSGRLNRLLLYPSERFT
jgi:hypothetical protein